MSAAEESSAASSDSDDDEWILSQDSSDLSDAVGGDTPHPFLAAWTSSHAPSAMLLRLREEYMRLYGKKALPYWNKPEWLQKKIDLKIAELEAEEEEVSSSAAAAAKSPSAAPSSSSSSSSKRALKVVVARTNKKKKQKLDAGAGSAAAASSSSNILCDPQNPVHGLGAGGLSARMLEEVAVASIWGPEDFVSPKLIAASSFHNDYSMLDSFQMCSVKWNDQKGKAECIPEPLHLQWKPGDDDIDPNLIKFMIQKNGLAALLGGIANTASCFRGDKRGQDKKRLEKIVEDCCRDFYSNDEIISVDDVNGKSILIKFRAFDPETLIMPSGLLVVINQMKKSAQDTQLCYRTRTAMQKMQMRSNYILLIVEVGRGAKKDR